MIIYIYEHFYNRMYQYDKLIVEKTHREFNIFKSQLSVKNNY